MFNKLCSLFLNQIILVTNFLNKKNRFIPIIFSTSTTKVVLEAHGYILLFGVVTVLGILKVLGILTVQGIMTALGMVTLLEHVLLHCRMMHCFELLWNCQQNLSYANLNRPTDRQTHIVWGMRLQKRMAQIRSLFITLYPCSVSVFIGLNKYLWCWETE